MAQLETCVRSIQLDGLVWGASKLVPVGYGIRKLQIQCVVEDEKVGTDLLEEEITKFEEHVSGRGHRGRGDWVDLGHWLLPPHIRRNSTSNFTVEHEPALGRQSAVTPFVSIHRCRVSTLQLSTRSESPRVCGFMCVRTC